MYKCKPKFLVTLIVLAGALMQSPANAQSKASLQDQYRKSCSPEFIAANPDFRTQCDFLRNTIDTMPDNVKKQIPKTGAAALETDGTTECKCERKLGQCRASATLRSTGNGGNLLKYIVKITPPAAQCAEVTVYLTSRSGKAQSMIREPIYRVVDGPTEIEWKSKTTTQYQILDADTECYICQPKASRNTSNDDEESAASANQREVRKSYETQYHQCLQGKSGGLDISKLDPKMRADICEEMRQQMLKN
jgi:hypothetical protein